MSELSELIEIAKNIERQNDEIIGLLKKIADEKEGTVEIPYVMPKVEENHVTIKSDEIPEGSILDVSCDVGEVHFIDVDIFRLSVKNNEMVIDNLTGSGQTNNFNVAKVISDESVRRNQSIGDATVILTDSSAGSLPQTLKLCYGQSAKRVFIPWAQAMELLGAPDTLQKVLELNFYKNEEDLITKLFKE